jgi:Matrixin/Putative metal-binding motif
MNKISKFDLIKKFKNMSILGSLLLLMVFSCLSTANAYQLLGYKWPQPSTTFYVNIPGADGLWDDTFENAMYIWGVDTNFDFMIVRGTYEDPCDATDGRNGVEFSSTDCGDSWGSTTLAITHSWYTTSTATTVQADIVFNSNVPWSVYSTSWSYEVNDFSRIAVHELGHALGLGHEDSGVSNIMGTYAGDITTPQQDDINGVAAMYGSACTYSISPSTGSFTSSGGNDSVLVTASSSTCAWTTSESLSWVSLSTTSGTGSGTVTVTVDVNTGSVRSGSVTIAGKTYSINQDSFTPVTTWFQDYDGDGYGNPGQGMSASSQPSGYVLNSGDCDDNDSTINPGATEIAGDGIDQDCDGVDEPSASNTIIIESDLSFTLSDAIYTSVFGDMNLWTDFTYFGDQGGILLWELADFGTTISAGNPITIAPDLSFSFDGTYSSPFGDMDLTVNFKFFGEQRGLLLWELDSYTVE